MKLLLPARQVYRPIAVGKASHGHETSIPRLWGERPTAMGKASHGHGTMFLDACFNDSNGVLLCITIQIHYKRLSSSLAAPVPRYLLRVELKL